MVEFKKPLTNKYLVGERVLDVVDLGEDGVGDGGGEGEEPERRDDLARPPQPRHGVRVQRVADRQVPEYERERECHSFDIHCFNKLDTLAISLSVMP